jgi:hypothetical protein
MWDGEATGLCPSCRKALEIGRLIAAAKNMLWSADKSEGQTRWLVRDADFDALGEAYRKVAAPASETGKWNTRAHLRQLTAGAGGEKVDVTGVTCAKCGSADIVCRECANSEIGRLQAENEKLAVANRVASDYCGQLRSENSRIQSLLEKAGLICFMREGTVEQIADHMAAVAKDGVAREAKFRALLKAARKQRVFGRPNVLQDFADAIDLFDGEVCE